VKKGAALFIIIILAILQVTIFNYFRVFSVKPDLLLIIVVLAALSFQFWGVLFLSISAGVLKDIFSINAFGINTLLFSLWGFLTIKLSREVSIENNLIRAVLVFIIVILNDIAARLINLTLGNFIPMGTFLRVTFLESLYTALVSLLVFRFMRPLENYSEP
jgi:rod shape-determining protein MreD